MPREDGPSGNPKPKQLSCAVRLEAPFLRSAPFSKCLPGISQGFISHLQSRPEEEELLVAALDHCRQLLVKVVEEVGFELYHVRLQTLPFSPRSEASVSIPSLTTNARVSGV